MTMLRLSYTPHYFAIENRHFKEIKINKKILVNNK